MNFLMKKHRKECKCSLFGIDVSDYFRQFQSTSAAALVTSISDVSDAICKELRWESQKLHGRIGFKGVVDDIFAKCDETIDYKCISKTQHKILIKLKLV